MFYVQLFYEFFKVGLFAIGGGLATYPFLHELGPRTGWFTVEELADMLAVSESTPGPLGVNMASYVGFSTGGVPGAVIATLGLVTPSIIIILIIARVLRAFRENRLVDAAFSGLRPASTGMIAAAGIGVVELALLNPELWRQTGRLADLFQWKAILLAAALLVLTRWVKWTKKLHPVIFIAASAAVGIAFSFAGA